VSAKYSTNLMKCLRLNFSRFVRSKLGSSYCFPLTLV